MGTAQVQGDLWGSRPRDWAELQESAFKPLYDSVLDEAKVASGITVLDIGCGAGLFCQNASQRGARVSGIDAAAGLVEIAAKRCPGADIRVGEMEQLPFADRTFDFVTGMNSFQYAADPVNALSQARRVAKPDGTVVVAVWGSVERCELAPYVAALAKLVAAPPPGAPGPFALSLPGALENFVKKAGLEPNYAKIVTVVFRFLDEQTALRALLAAGPAIRAIRNSSEAAARAGVAEAIAPYRQKDGSYSMSNEFRYLASRVRAAEP